MAWSPGEVYLNGLDFFEAVVDRIPDKSWQGDSVCEGWRAVDVLGHVGAATEYGIALLAGRAPAWRPSVKPGDAVIGEPARWWGSLAADARDAVSDVDLVAGVDTPTGRRSVGDGLSFPAIDLFVHGWDLARTAGIAVDIPFEAVEFAHHVLDRLPPEQLRSPAVFAAEQAPPPDATPTERFIAWTGRNPRWQPQ